MSRSHTPTRAATQPKTLKPLQPDLPRMEDISSISPLINKPEKRRCGRPKTTDRKDDSLEICSTPKGQNFLSVEEIKNSLERSTPRAAPPYARKKASISKAVAGK